MSEDRPVPDPNAAPDPDPDAVLDPASAATAPEPKPRRRGRTAVLIAAAAVLGVLAGAGTGYQIQYQRPDTPLPPLAQPVLKQPTAPAAKATPLTAAEDTLVTYDGDLRKLLLKKPTGAKQWSNPVDDNGWESLYTYAASFDDEKYMFSKLNENAFRRMAVATWTVGGYASYVDTEVSLIQFRDEGDTYAEEHFTGQKQYMPQAKEAGNQGKKIPGSGDGYAWVYSKPWTKAGYVPQYRARALAREGNIVMDIWVYSARPIADKTIMSLAKRELERL
ncbi:MAG: hypothetical protein QOI83_2878 [Streptomycetaceae bacterium]|nr:hypothetical protein [Streptomycetaceae bacterium]